MKEVNGAWWWSTFNRAQDGGRALNAPLPREKSEQCIDREEHYADVCYCDRRLGWLREARIEDGFVHFM
jgi:hypothetical protein